MKKIFFVLFFFFVFSAQIPYFFKSKGKLTPKERAQKLVSTMSFDEQMKLVSGVKGPYVGNVVSQEKFKIPELHLEDGPQGVADGVDKVTCFPNALSVVATFNRDLMEEYASVLAEEQRGKGTNIMLGPMTNIARVPFGGRNFESFGEDPYLASEMVSRNVKGIQKKGVMGCAKHFCNNNQEDNRGDVSVKIDERTQHEIYYPPFLSAVRAGVGSYMCSYNRVNGTHACEQKELLTDALKGWMGFEGFVMSDWGATHSTVDSANNGLDMEMPGSQYFGDALKKAVDDGKVQKSRIADMAVRILTPMYAVGIMDNPQTGNLSADVRSKEHTDFCRKLAEETTVLVKNDGILPIDGKYKKIAVVGDSGKFSPEAVGGGSGHVKCSYIVTPYDGILDKNLSQVSYARTQPIDKAAKLAKDSDLAIVFVGVHSSEGSDRKSLGIGIEQDTLIEAVAKVQPNTIVVLNVPGSVLMPWINKVRGVIVAWFPGQEDGRAITSILYGDSNPSARLPITFPISDEQTPLKQKIQYPGVNGKTEYLEKLLVGYRWYDEKNENPLFPFGHGLSYSKFVYDEIKVSGSPLTKGGKITVQLTITNEGELEGKEVPQLYLSYPKEANKPPSVLRGFESVSIEAGKSEVVTFQIEYGESVSVWDTVLNDWKVIEGTYDVLVGSSSRDIRKHGSFDVKNE